MLKPLPSHYTAFSQSLSQFTSVTYPRHIFAWTKWPEMLWPLLGIIRPRDLWLHGVRWCGMNCWLAENSDSLSPWNVQYFRRVHTELTNQVVFYITLRDFTICPCSECYFSKSTANSLSTMAFISWVTTHSCNRAFCRSKFRRSWWCSHLADQIFDRTT